MVLVMNNTTDQLAQAKTELADAWNTLTALQSNYAPTSVESLTLQKAKMLLVARIQTLSDLQERRNQRAYEVATRTSWGYGRAG